MDPDSTFYPSPRIAKRPPRRRLPVLRASTPSVKCHTQSPWSMLALSSWRIPSSIRSRPRTSRVHAEQTPRRKCPGTDCGADVAPRLSGQPFQEIIRLIVKPLMRPAASVMGGVSETTTELAVTLDRNQPRGRGTTTQTVQSEQGAAETGTDNGDRGSSTINRVEARVILIQWAGDHCYRSPGRARRKSHEFGLLSDFSPFVVVSQFHSAA